MGILLNPNNADFRMDFKSKIYIDKSMLIEETNSIIGTGTRFVCISRPRRFGKSMAANMLTAYYSCGCDSKEFFDKLKISETDDYIEYLNKYNVVHINMVQYMGEAGSVEELISFITEDLYDELSTEFPDVRQPARKTLIKMFHSFLLSTNGTVYSARKKQ